MGALAQHDRIMHFNKCIEPGFIRYSIDRSSSNMRTMVRVAVPDLDAKGYFAGKDQGDCQDTLCMLSLTERHGALEQDTVTAEVAENSGHEFTAALYLQLDVLLEVAGDVVTFFPPFFGNVFL